MHALCFSYIKKHEALKEWHYSEKNWKTIHSVSVRIQYYTKYFKTIVNLFPLLKVEHKDIIYEESRVKTKREISIDGK